MNPNPFIDLTIGGVQIAFGILVIVEALKHSGLVSSEQDYKRANIIVSIVLAALWFVSEQIPDAKPVIATAYVALVGSLSAGLMYRGVSAAVRYVTRKSNGSDAS